MQEFSFKTDKFIHDMRCAFAQKLSNECGCFYLAYLDLRTKPLENSMSYLLRLQEIVKFYPKVKIKVR